MITSLGFHPLANILPLLDEKELAELVTSIEASGKLLEPITLHEGKILDGRNRYLACMQLGIEPETQEYIGNDPIGFVCGKNLNRRHLTASQRAMIMAEYAKLKNGTNRYTLASQCCEASLTRKQAAEKAGVAPRTIDDAKVVLANGTPAEIADAKTGEASVASIAKKVRQRKKKDRRSGPRLIVPEGYSCLSDAIRHGISLERDGAPVEEVSKRLGMFSYRLARDIVLLSERNDLSAGDATAVRHALIDLDERRQVSHLQKTVRKIATKIWGQRGNRYKSEKSRSDAFCNAVSFVLTTCSTAAEITIPHLGGLVRKEALASLQEAIAALKSLQLRLRKESGNG